MKQEKGKVGEVRVVGGITFTAEEAFKNYRHEEIGIYWRCGDIGHTVAEYWLKGDDHPFRVDGVYSRTFEAAAIRGLKRRAGEVRKARHLIAAYDAPELADQRAAVEALG